MFDFELLSAQQWQELEEFAEQVTRQTLDPEERLELWEGRLEEYENEMLRSRELELARRQRAVAGLPEVPAAKVVQLFVDLDAWRAGR